MMPGTGQLCTLNAVPERARAHPELPATSLVRSKSRHAVSLAAGVGGHIRRATLCAGQHAHATGLAVALDDGQALVLD